MKWCLRMLAVCVLATTGCGGMEESEPTSPEAQQPQREVDAQGVPPASGGGPCGNTTCESGTWCCEPYGAPAHCISDLLYCDYTQ